MLPIRVVGDLIPCQANSACGREDGGYCQRIAAIQVRIIGKQVSRRNRDARVLVRGNRIVLSDRLSIQRLHCKRLVRKLQIFNRSQRIYVTIRARQQDCIT